MQYSGWFELFLYLPQKRHYAHREFVPLVWQDFAALRRRNARHINVLLAHWSWRTYNAYLKSNRIASGVANYDEVTRLMLGVPLDARACRSRVSLLKRTGTRERVPAVCERSFNREAVCSCPAAAAAARRLAAAAARRLAAAVRMALAAARRTLAALMHRTAR